MPASEGLFNGNFLCQQAHKFPQVRLIGSDSVDLSAQIDQTAQEQAIIAVSHQ